MCLNHKDCPRDPTSDLLCLSRPIAEHSSLPMAVVEAATAIVRYANPAFCRLISKKGEELIGRPFAEMVPEGKACLTVLDRVYRTGEPETYTKHSTELEKSDPNTWSYVMWPVLGGDQHPLGIMIQITEIALLQQQTAAMNEALLIAGLRQHELTEAEEKQNTQLQEEINERRRAQEALRLLTKTLEQRVAERTAELRQRALQLQRLALEVSDVEDRERRRFAMILHDDLQQRLASLRFKIWDIVPRDKADEHVEDKIKELEADIDDSIRVSRSLSLDLSPPVLRQNGLIAALAWLAKEIQSRHGLSVALNADKQADRNGRTGIRAVSNG